MRVAATILLVSFITSCQEQTRQEQTKSNEFDLNGRSTISIINRTNDSLAIKIENWYAIPLEAQKLDTLLASSGSLSYTLKVQGRNYYSLIAGKTKYSVFTRPNANDTIVFENTISSDSVTFSGDSKDINRFLLKKLLAFNSADADWMSRARATHNAENFSTVISINDSIMQKHLSFTRQNSNDVPAWYTNFEIDRLHYLNVGSKINSFFYRKAMLGKVESFPSDFSDSIASIKAQNLELLGNMRYMYFLNDYISYKTDSSFSSSKPTSKEEWQNHYNRLFTTTDAELTGLVKDFVLTSSISGIIDARSHILDTNWIRRVENKQMQDYLYGYLATHQVLPTGTAVPYFYLKAVNGQHYEPESFQNQVVLINFWATWCKPCIQEFPQENALVEKFATEPVTIVNICIDSDTEKWKEMVRKHELTTLNLIAEDNWNNVLTEKFDIRGLPHSILIDSRGKVVQNKCPKASEGIATQITALLNTMKAEADG